MEITPLIKTNFVAVEENATVSEMIGKLKQAEERAALVFRNGKYLGLLEKKRLLKSRLGSADTKLKGLTQKTPLLSEHADVIETAYLLYQSNLDLIPIERQKKIVGILQALDVAHLGVHLPEAKPWKVEDAKLVYVKPLAKDQPLANALQQMYSEHLDHLPVFDQGKLYGILSYRDVLKNFLTWSPQREFSKKYTKDLRSKAATSDMPHLVSLPVSNFCTKESLIMVKANESIRNAVESMRNKDVNCLPVLQGGEFLGLLTTKNVLRLVASLKIQKKHNIQFVGLHDLKLEEYQREDLQKIASNEAFKLQRMIRNQFQLILHLKGYHRVGSQKNGEQQKYAVNLRLEFPGQMIAASADDWDVETALRKTFDNTKNEVKKKFHLGSSWKKSYE